jgi:drug/metabolite transporter (DMT)-like permease
MASNSLPPASPAGTTPQDRWVAAMPTVFVLLWSTGFVGAKLGTPFAPPFTFLLLRFVVVVTALALAAIAVRAPRPQSWGEVGRIGLVGLLIHGAYLGGVFVAISVGVPAGAAALIVSLQPLATALVSGPYLGERLHARQWLGLAFGLLGLALVVVDKLAWRGGDWLGVAAIGWAWRRRSWRSSASPAAPSTRSGTPPACIW